MLNRQQLKKYRELRGLTTRKVAEYCDISQPMITQIETGVKHLNQHCHDEIIRGINEATKAIEREKRIKKNENNVEKMDNVQTESVKKEDTPIVDEKAAEEKQPKTPKRRATRVSDTKKTNTRKKATKAEA